MADHETSEMVLFGLLAESYLMTNGAVGLKDHIWKRGNVDGGTQFMRIKDGDAEITWHTAAAALEDLTRTLLRLQTACDEVVFFQEDSMIGVTWRMLKIDMPFLRIVLKKDRNAMTTIIERLVSLMDQIIRGDTDEEAREAAERN